MYVKLGLQTAPLNISLNELLKAFGYQDPWNFHVFFFCINESARILEIFLHNIICTKSPPGTWLSPTESASVSLLKQFVVKLQLKLRTPGTLHPSPLPQPTRLQTLWNKTDTKLHLQTVESSEVKWFWLLFSLLPKTQLIEMPVCQLPVSTGCCCSLLITRIFIGHVFVGRHGLRRVVAVIVVVVGQQRAEFSKIKKIR